jgi:hypothetical protein
MRGRKHTPESRAKMSASRLGKKRPPFTLETRKRMSIAKRGRIFTDEHRAKLSAAHAGKVPWNKGRTASFEVSEKNRVAQTGKKLSPETCARMSEVGRVSPGLPLVGRHRKEREGSSTKIRSFSSDGPRGEIRNLENARPISRLRDRRSTILSLIRLFASCLTVSRPSRLWAR